jgi:hypothetical protein
MRFRRNARRAPGGGSSRSRRSFERSEDGAGEVIGAQSTVLGAGSEVVGVGDAELPRATHRRRGNWNRRVMTAKHARWDGYSSGASLRAARNTRGTETHRAQSCASCRGIQLITTRDRGER